MCLFAYCNNNPISFSDQSGQICTDGFRIVVDGIASCDWGGGCGGYIAPRTGASAVSSISTYSNEDGLAALAVIGAVTTYLVSKEGNKTYTVYRLVDPVTNTVKYIGRTSNFEKRKYMHK